MTTRATDHGSLQQSFYRIKKFDIGLICSLQLNFKSFGYAECPKQYRLFERSVSHAFDFFSAQFYPLINPKVEFKGEVTSKYFLGTFVVFSMIYHIKSLRADLSV